VAPLAIGTDGGGSIRCPASCAGITGIKATLGRVPQESPDGFANYMFVGPMARRVEDVALLLSVIAGPLADDPYSIGMPAATPAALPNVEQAAKGLRIGWIEHFGKIPPRKPKSRRSQRRRYGRSLTTAPSSRNYTIHASTMCSTSTK